MKIQRTLLILFYLMKKGAASTRELADYLEVSVRTVYRDIEELKTAGVGILSTPGVRGGHRVAADFKLDKLLFSNKDLATIQLSSKVLSQFEKTEFAESARALLKKIEVFFNEVESEESQKMLLDWQYSFHDENYRQKLILAERAVNSSEIIYIRYESPLCEHMSTSGYVEPYGLVNKVGYWYLIGYCQQMESFRAMNIAFMNNLLLTGKYFNRISHFSLSEFWKKQKTR